MTGNMNYNRRSWWIIIPLLALVVISITQKSTAGITITEIVLLVFVPLIGGWGIFIWRLTTRKLVFSLSKPAVWLLLFATWSILSVIPAIINGTDLVTWGRRVYPPLTLVIVALSTSTAIHSKNQVPILYNFIIIVSTIVVAHSLSPIFMIDISGINNLQYLRKFGRAKFASVLIMLTIPYVIKYKRLEDGFKLAVSIIAAFIGWAGLFVSFTRTIWVSTFIGTVFASVIYIYWNRPKLRTASLVCGVILATVAIVFVAVPNQIQLFVVERLKSLPNALQSKSLQDRLFELRGLLSDFFSNYLMILIGNGYGTEFSFYSVSPFSWEGVGWTSNAYSHNYYAYILWSTGIIGLTCFLKFWHIIFRESTRKLLHSPIMGDKVYLLGCTGSLVVLLVSALTVPFLTEFKWCVIFGIVVGIIIHIINNGRL